MKTKLMIIFVSLSTVLYTQSLHGGVGEATWFFLMVEPGNRASGMGNAFVALVDDATATWWNPAGLAFQKKIRATGTYTNWLPGLHLDDSYYGFFGGILPIEDFGTLGANLAHMELGEIELRDDLNTPLGTYHAYGRAWTLSFASFVQRNLAVGINVKYVDSHLSDRGNACVAIDLGFLYQKKLSREMSMSLGANLQNLGLKMPNDNIYFGSDRNHYDYYDRDAPIPTNLKMGYCFTAKTGIITVNQVFDINKLLVRKHPDGETDPLLKALYSAWTDEPFFYDLIYNLGAEMWIMDQLGWRIGYWNDELGKVKPFTYGFSWRTPDHFRFSVQFDISFYNEGEGHPLDGTTRYSFTAMFPVRI